MQVRDMGLEIDTGTASSWYCIEYVDVYPSLINSIHLTASSVRVAGNLVHPDDWPPSRIVQTLVL